MARINDFRDLDAWKVAMDLAVSVYKFIERLPGCERFELASQMRRAAVSIPSNSRKAKGTERPRAIAIGPGSRETGDG
jgi:four helix bundle protein